MKKILLIATMILVAMGAAEAKEKYTLKQIAQMSEMQEQDMYKDHKKEGRTNIRLIAGTFFEIKDANVKVDVVFDYSKANDNGSSVGGTDEIEGADLSDSRDERKGQLEEHFLWWFNKAYSEDRKVELTSNSNAPYRLVIKYYRYDNKLKRSWSQMWTSGLMYLYKTGNNTPLAVASFCVSYAYSTGLRKISDNEITKTYGANGEVMADQLNGVIKKAKEEKKKK